MVNTQEERKSLWALQDALLQAEEEIISAEDLSSLIGQVAGKIDAIKEMVDLFDSEAARWGEYAKAMAGKKKAAERAADRLRQYVTDSLIAHDTSFELGNQWKVKLTASQRVVLNKEDPTIDDLLDIGQLGVIRTAYEWDKKRIKTLLEEKNEQIEKLARIETSNSVRFSPNTRSSKQ